MDLAEQKQSLGSGRLKLTGKRKWLHYLDALMFAVLSLVFLGMIANGFIEKTGYYSSPYIFILLAFPVFTALVFYSQYTLLKFKQINTNLSKKRNYDLVKATCRALRWQVKIDNAGFIEAYVKSSGIWTWSDQMFTVVITDHLILFNSISDVDDYRTQPFTWGQNGRNKRAFIKMFDLLSTQAYDEVSAQ